MNTYTGTCKNNDVLGFAKELNGVVDGVVLGQLGPPGELARDRNCQKRVIGLIWCTLEECRRRYTKCRA